MTKNVIVMSIPALPGLTDSYVDFETLLIFAESFAFLLRFN